MVALDAAILMHPRTWEASGHVESFTDPLVQCMGKCKKRWRADHSREPGRRGRRAVAAPSAAASWATRAEFNLMFETFMGPVREDAARDLPAPRDRAGHLRQLQERAPVRRAASRRSASPRSARRSATRSRPATSSSARASSSRWRSSSSCRPPRREEWHQRWMDERMRWYTDLGIRPDHLQLREHGPDELSHYSAGTSDIEYLFPMGWSELEGIANRTRLRPPPARRVLGREARLLRHRRRRALRPVRDRALRRRRPRHARLHGGRLRRGGGRGPQAHGAAAAPAPRAGEGRGAAAGSRDGHAREGARDLRGAARA